MKETRLHHSSQQQETRFGGFFVACTLAHTGFFFDVKIRSIRPHRNKRLQ